MAIHYHCRHCGTKLGSIEQTSIHSETLGLHKLTEQERLEMVTYDSLGNIHIKAICEDCQEALERNPDYHQYDFIIH
ncbi:anti-sigma-F factor Fin family protein [Neobacillus thermocopriae]|uniref:Anti-sigma-F factor Fin family protein n=1 Tax=Neobacillus thermocopriae TaxID=1215031 RepID=A0A6B3TT19_9BACI|nr:anti-sigma-F factor Fin family protein [Neobacillus thermocopriae]MED3624596.1 anti-sigma-F factor Fin family protein [Neobacillus thermocopriae]MED3714562.1 anti-sigma-F factor Fin family protein [Neobacillus thermocopriae]NEX79973.1 anti-sigma-F factor Fin family protein [Neobacillus thermocopriae]